MRRALTATIATAVLFAGCGGDDSDATDSPTETTDPVTVPTADDCSDTPDPAEFADLGDEIPVAGRPCAAPTELVVHTIVDGTGPAAEADDRMVVDYAGVRVDDGELFDTSFNREVPFDLQLGRGSVIAGWDEGLVGTQAGGLYRLDIPADLAYGDTPPGGGDGIIQAGDALSFTIAVRAVVPATTVDDAPLDIDVTPSSEATEVSWTDVEVGDGATIEAGDTAIVHVLLVRGDNEVVLFNTWERNDPLQIVMDEGGSIPGLIEGLEGAKVGSVRIVTMPPEKAFGADGNPSLGLPADKDLIVVAAVVGVY